jgi:hypothetical protein
VVIHNLDIKGFAIDESEAQPPLVVDADTPLAGAVASQGLQPVRARLSLTAASSCASRIRARRLKSVGSRRDLPMANKRSVSLSAKLLITRQS